MTWQKWDTSRLQVKGLVGFASVSISPNYGRPWTKQGRSFHHSDSWMVTCRCQCHELLKMIFSRKSNSSWHSFLTKRFCWNGTGGGVQKNPFLEPLHLSCWKSFAAFDWVLFLFGCQDLPLDGLGTHHGVQVAYEQKLLTQEEQSNWAVRTSLLIVVVVFRSWSILGHEKGDGWLINWCQCCACFAVMQAIIDSNACLYCFYSSKISELRAEYKQDSWHWWLYLKRETEPLEPLVWAEDGVEDSWYLWFIAWTEGKSTFGNPKWTQKYSLPFRRLRHIC